MECVELEARAVPATFTVTNTLDTGAGSLRAQIAAANGAPGDDVISFDAGVFTSAKTITLTSGEIAITSNLIINGPAAVLTISGNNASRIFNINDGLTGTAIAVTLNDLTFTKGITAGAADGAAVFIQDEAVTFSDCTLTANSSSSDGGAIRLEGSTGNLSLTRTVLSSNTASVSGGAVSIAAAGTFSTQLCSFTSNTALAGGGIGALAGGSINIQRSTFHLNNATSGDGGGVALNGTPTSWSIRESTFHSNAASSDGGAILLGNASAGNLVVQNCTITGNGATTGNGGGIARTGGTAIMTITSSIISGNAAATTADDLFSTGNVSVLLSLVGTKTGATAFNGDAFTDANLGAAPLLGSLQNNGGPTLTRLPSVGSPAIDNGSNPGGDSTDQRGTGYPRTRGGAPDIGAVETYADFVVTNTNNSGAGSLRQATLDANAAIGLDTIVFDAAAFSSAKTITLTTGEMLLSEAVTIDGPTAELTINANNASRIFRMEGGNTVGTTLRDLRLINGKVTGSNDGGAILVAGLGGVQNWSNLDFISNDTADAGGAIAITATATSVTIDGCDFDSNTAATGGGLFLAGGASLIVRNSSFHGNSASGQAGAISIFGLSSFNITNSTISTNTAASGGGISWNTSGNNNTVNNCTITGNSAGVKGGGIYVFNGTTNFTSCIVSGNTAGSNDDISSPGTTNVNFSAIGSATGFTLTGANNLAFGSNLLLGTLQNNGGNGPSHVPAVNSPVLGKGSNPTSASFDARGSGFPRSRGGSVDIGAIEVGQFVVTNTNASGAGSLLQATLDANAAGGADSITFDETVFSSTKTIVPSTTLELSDSTDILAPAVKVTVNGNLANRIVFVSGGSDFTFSNLNLVFGSSTTVGGAVLVNGIGGVQNLTFTDCNLSFNTATSNGGAIHISGNDSLTFIRCSLSNNRTTGAGIDGGAINMVANGTLIFQQSTVSDNTATGNGGGIAAQASTSTVRFFDSTVSGNSSGGRGGGILTNGTFGSNNLLIRNSTLSDNTAASFGGGLAWSASAGTAIIQNSTITNNTSNAAAGGGGISVESGSGNLNIESSIVSGNINAGAPDIDNPNSTSVKTSAIGDNLGFAKTDLGGNLPFQPHANLKLGAFANNGGPTLTHLPLTGSPLIDAGSNPAGLLLDQRGAQRSLEGGIDIGSTEFLSFVVKNTNDSGPDSLRQIILNANATPGTQSITFDETVFGSAKTIVLTSGELMLADSVTIAGPAAGVTISGNDASRIFTIDGVDPLFVSLANLTLRDGVAKISSSLAGGAIHMTNDTLMVTNCILTENSAGASGGAIAVSDTGSSTLTIIGSTLTHNTAGGNSAGAISTGNGSVQLSILDSTLSHNSAVSAAGGAIRMLSTGSLTIRNSTLSHNIANLSGGAIRVESLPITIQNSTITANTAGAGNGGAISTNNSAVITVDSSILFGNSASTGGQEISNAGSGTVTATTSLIASKTGVTNFMADAFTNLNLGVNPQLGPLANNGGPTLTHLPAFTSPAINNGSNPAGLATDQRGAGFTRSFGLGVDIGAIESRTFVVTNTNNSGAGSLRQAVLDANAELGLDTIVFEATTFATAKTITLTGGQITVSDSVTILGTGKSLLTVSGNNTSRIFGGAAAGGIFDLRINNMTLTGGNGTTSGVGNGGAIFVENDNVFLSNVILTGNRGNNGGGLWSNNGGSITVEDSTITGNSAVSNNAGGLGINNTAFSPSLIIRRSTISNNTAGSTGSAITAGNVGNLLIEDSTIFANTGTGSTLTINANSVTATLAIRNTTISGNSSNSASGAGGVNLDGVGSLSMTNSTITANNAGPGIGGIHMIGSTTISIESSIVAGNTGAVAADIRRFTGFITAKNSAIGSAPLGGGFTDLGGNLPFGIDLRLAPLANNGGPTLSHLPLNTSPLIDAGSNPESLTTDQRGLPRTIGGSIDIGATEFNGTSFTVNGSAAQRSRITTMKVSFAAPVNAATLTGLNAITLTRSGVAPGGTLGTVVRTGATGPNGRIIVSPASGLVNSVTLTFDNADGSGSTAGVEFGSLADGRWQLAIPSLAFTSTLNDAYLRRLFGDVENNGTVDATDLGFFPPFGTAAGSPFDFNGNSDIDSGTDFAQFGNRFGVTL